MEIDIKRAAQILKSKNNIVILTHQNPDGDTLGCAFSLYYTLRDHGKNVKVLNEKEIPKKYSFLYDEYRQKDFEEEFVVAVDIASQSLFGRDLERYNDKVDLCIDHHKSNTMFAKNTVLDASVTAACEVCFDIIKEMYGDISDKALLCIYTGVSTDCGCFKYSNTTSKAHYIASLAIKRNIDVYRVNHAMFESKSRAQLDVEKYALQTLEFFYDGRCSLITVTQDILKKADADESDLDALPSMARQIQNVEVGIVIKERNPGEFKISVRTGKFPDASAICECFGGGGHTGAAGCTIFGEPENVKKQIIETVGKFI